MLPSDNDLNWGVAGSDACKAAAWASDRGPARPARPALSSPVVCRPLSCGSSRTRADPGEVRTRLHSMTPAASMLHLATLTLDCP